MLLCNFHREQAWHRWLSTTDNDMRPRKDEALVYLRRIASLETEETYKTNVKEMKEK